jgi:uncharacterized protein (DUF488 family)
VKILTIGHSNHPIDVFVELLRRHEVEVLADVRSTPYSRFQPQFNRPALERALMERGLGYEFMGEELGARPRDPGCYEGERVSYAKLAATSAFKAGIARLQELASVRCVALVCAERDPLDCHRTILVGRELERAGSALKHILFDGSLEPNKQSLERLITALDLTPSDLFRSPSEVIEAAYEAQAARVAYVRPGKEPKTQRRGDKSGETKRRV